MLIALIATLAAHGAPNLPAIQDPVAPLVQLEADLRANNPISEDPSFREELPVTTGKTEATLEKLPLAPEDTE
jgi:hypothetical protein